MSKFWVVCGTAVATLILVAVFTESLFQGFQVADELQAARQAVKVAEADLKKVGLRLDVLREEVGALTTPRHMEALRLWASWREICERITLAKMIETGDRACADAIGQGEFPSRKRRLQLLADPEAAILVGKEFILDRCTLVEGEKPKICIEAVRWAQ